VDFSESLINRYRENNPDLDLVQSDALSFMRATDERYDVIFSYGVLQYLDRADLAELFSLQADRLQPGGRCVHFGIPVKELASSFHEGIGSTMAVYRDNRRGMLQKLKSRYMNKIGHWHSMRDLYRLSVECGFDTRISSNMAYFYRINLSQRRG
jgi:cyclopropane fatty-acyl-phospholipid synthase-like methyltransferase